MADPNKMPGTVGSVCFSLVIGRVRPYSRDRTATRRVRRPREATCGPKYHCCHPGIRQPFLNVVGTQRLLFSFLSSMFISALNASHSTSVSPNTLYLFPSHFSPVAHVQHYSCNPLFVLVLSARHELRGIREILPSVAMFALDQSSQASLA